MSPGFRPRVKQEAMGHAPLLCGKDERISKAKSSALHAAAVPPSSVTPNIEQRAGCPPAEPTGLWHSAEGIGWKK